MQAEKDVQALLQRNKAALEAAVDAVAGHDLLGADLEKVVRPLISEEDLAAMNASDDVDFVPAGAGV